jgi:hypothetical protein
VKQSTVFYQTGIFSPAQGEGCIAKVCFTASGTRLANKHCALVGRTATCRSTAKYVIFLLFIQRIFPLAMTIMGVIFLAMTIMGVIFLRNDDYGCHFPFVYLENILTRNDDYSGHLLLFIRGIFPLARTERGRGFPVARGIFSG